MTADDQILKVPVYLTAKELSQLRELLRTAASAGGDLQTVAATTLGQLPRAGRFIWAAGGWYEVNEEYRDVDGLTVVPLADGTCLVHPEMHDEWSLSEYIQAFGPLTKTEDSNG